MRARRRVSHAGFTLIEALIALTVLSLGLMGLAQLQARVFASAGQSKTQTVAVDLAHQKIEELRATPYDEIQSAADTPEHRAGHQASFARRWVVSERADPDYKAVRVTTSWQSPAGESRSVGLSAFIARSIAQPLDPVGIPAAED